MANLAAALRDEIRRLARKEIRASVLPLRKTVAALRRRVAEQKKIIRSLELATRRSMAVAKAKAAEAAPAEAQIRFSAEWVRKHRKKLRMSRRVYAQLVGVSPQSIFGWESGRSRPRRQALQAWSRIRAMGARELKAMIEEAKPARGVRRRVRRVKRVRRAKKK